MSNFDESFDKALAAAKAFKKAMRTELRAIEALPVPSTDPAAGPTLCSCGDSDIAHRLRAGKRTGCTNHGCPCKKFRATVYSEKLAGRRTYPFVLHTYGQGLSYLTWLEEHPSLPAAIAAARRYMQSPRHSYSKIEIRQRGWPPKQRPRGAMGTVWPDGRWDPEN